MAARNLYALDIFFDHAFGRADFADLHLALDQNSFESRAVALRLAFAAQKGWQGRRAKGNALAFVEYLLDRLLLGNLHTAVFDYVFVAASRIIAVWALGQCDVVELRDCEDDS
jgi:hypothetical protein